jgi:hypothetical protein
MPRVLPLALTLLLLAFIAGCIFPYCAYPTLGYTPSVQLDTPPDVVHAFRVDITRARADLGVFQFYPYHGAECLTEVPVTNTDEVPAQIKPAVSYGLVVIGIALNFFTHTGHSLALRLYRPGYELVEIHSWELVNRVAWRPAPDIKAQEKALDTLFPFARLEPGSKSPAHKKALLFGAAEYERLAAATHEESDRTRLTKQATSLRGRAEE